MADSTSAIEVADLVKVYGSRRDESVTAVDGLSLSVEEGTVIGLLGPNGAGKTTLIKSMLGLIAPTSGQVLVDGIDVSRRTERVAARVSAVLEGARNVYWRLTVRENMALFARLQGIPVAEDEHDEIIRLLNFEEKADEPVMNLSRGMKQKTSLACAFARKTPIMFLDEPTLGLDVETSIDLRRRLRRLVDAENLTVVLSSHDMDSVQKLCDRVVVMDGGRILEDRSVDDLLELFRTQSYRITVEGALSNAARAEMEDAFNATHWTDRDDRVECTVLLEDGDEFYDCVDFLRGTGVTPVSVHTQEPDLEEAFLRLVRDETPIPAGETTR